VTQKLTDRQADKNRGHIGYADNDRQTYEFVCASLSRQTRRQCQTDKPVTLLLKDKHTLTDKPPGIGDHANTDRLKNLKVRSQTIKYKFTQILY
jgi:hypothetical protein